MTERAQADDCGCCEGLWDRVPALVSNRPGLSEIAYRVGTWSQFKQSMLAGLGALQGDDGNGLQTRADDDFTIALIDAWAVAGDVLTFYIERTAQEHYLGTATERRSVDELVQLIGYRLQAGVAASTWVAFTMETPPAPLGEALVAPASGVPERVPVRERIRVQSIPKPEEEPQTFETVESIEAIAAWNLLRPRRTAERVPRTDDTDAWLEGVGLNLSPGDVLLFVADTWSPASPSGRWDLRRVTAIDPDPVAQRTRVKWSGALQNLDLITGDDVHIYALRQRASLFGYNAPNPQLFSNEVLARLNNITDWTFDEIVFPDDEDTIVRLSSVVAGLEEGGWLVLRGPTGSSALAHILDISEQSRSAYAVSAQISVLRIDRDDETVLDAFDGSAVRSTAVLLGSELLPLAEAPLSDPVPRDRIVLDHDLDPIDAPRSVIVRGRESIESTPTEQGVAGEADVIAERAVVVAVEPGEGGATLVLETPLVHNFERKSTEILGNVARATHGETIAREVLGSGNGARPFQQFALRSMPLTRVRGELPGKIESTLEVWVNEVRWLEVESFFGHGPRDRVYITRTADDGTTVVQFGDGESGARLPTGQDNVVATYRHGSGMEGMLEAGQLSLLLDRPLGTRGVTNPLAPEGAAPRQEASDARENAPRSVITLGRIVSLRDYEDYARDFLGIAKAAAVWTWDGTKRGVLITIAGLDGAVLAPGDLVHDELTRAIEAVGSPHVPVVVREHRPVSFQLGGSLRVETDREPTTVLAAARASLADRFGFAARGLGQMVSLSEIYAAIHEVPGVASADLDHLYRGTDARLDPFLVAAGPANGDSPDELGAELLSLDPASLDDLEVAP